MYSAYIASTVLLGFLACGTAWCSKVPGPSEISAADEEARIIRGIPAKEGQFPWVVALYFQGKFVCGASLLSSTTVLTAAHCVVIDNAQRQPNEFYGIAGVVNRSSNEATRLAFSSIIVHPDYDTENLRNDIALLKVVDQVPLTERVKPLCVANANTPLDRYTDALAMGWGSTSRVRETPVDILQYALQKLAPHITCRVRYIGIVTDKQMCADGLGTGICNGDSGGPLVHIGKNQSPVQLGVASFVSNFPGCGSLILQPGVFTRVSAYAQWIRQNTGDEYVCGLDP